MQQPAKRLVEYFRPDSYELNIDQNSEELTFSGSVAIQGTLQKLPLILHSSDLSISSVTVDNVEHTYTTDNEAQELIIDSADLALGDITVTISFSSTITKQMHGLYPCFFTHEGVEKRLLATQFESHHAREVFPCVDEPEAKATFLLNLTTGKEDVTVSNMPIQAEHVAGNRKTVTFSSTPIMSTYLLAWVSGELIYEESTSTHGVTVRTYATPVHAGKLAYSVDVACRAIDFLDDYFNVPYPLEKFDQIALPDFAAGGMENWGCVTFRESALLFDPKLSDLSDKQYVAEVVIHELAHQWFGNLVTMRWWNDLWLNEGFASWVPYLVRDELYPEWNVWEHFATGDLMIGLRADALKNTHPIVVNIDNPSEISSAFDSISYDKGCSVINLLYRYIGKDAFRLGLQNYLKTHAYSNAETKDLWDAWSTASGKDVADFMSCWTEKPGFPIVTVDSTANKTVLSQERFFLSQSSKDIAIDQTIWPIPLMRSTDDTEILTAKSMEISSNTKLNSGQSGFYRTIYSGSLKVELEQSLESGTTAPVDALGLINDASEAAKAGYHSTVDVLDLLLKARYSTNEALITTALGEFADCRNILSDTFDLQKLAIAKFIGPSLERLGIEPKEAESIDDELLRPTILSSASYANNQEVVAWAIKQFLDADSPENIRPDARSIAYQTAVREKGDVRTYEKLFRWYQLNTIPGERTSLAIALASFKDEILFNRSLGYITSEDVKLQDSMYWIAYGLSNRHNKQLAWDWVRTHWNWVIDNFGREKELDYYLRFCSRGFATKEHLQSYTDFFGSANLVGSQRAFEQGKETIQWQADWKARDTQPVLDWLKNFT